MKVPKAHKLPSGAWNIYLRLGGEGISITAYSEKECIAKARQIKADYLAGNRLERSNETCNSLAERYINERRAVLSPSTVYGYEKILLRYPALHSLPAASVRWQAEVSRAAKQYSPKTVRNVAGVLNWALVKAVQNRLIVSNPMAGVVLPRKQKPVRKVLDPDRAAWLLERMQVEDWMDLPLWLFIASTGCRLSEALGIMYDNINLTTGDYTITQTVTVKDGVAVIQHRTKTANAERSGRVPAEILPALRKKAAFNRARSETMEGWEDHGLLFCDDHGRPMKRYTVMNRFFKYQLRHGISKDDAVGAHAFRHLVATMLIRAGVSDAAVARQMGHYSAAYTRAAYMDAYDSDVEEVSRVTGDFIRSTWVRFPSLAPMKPGKIDE